MKKLLMAIEDLAPEAVTGDEPPHAVEVYDVADAMPEDDEIVGYTGDLGECLDVSDTVEEVVDQLEEPTARMGLGDASADALSIAVEHLLKRCKIEQGARPVFESQVTLRTKRANLALAIESFKDVLKKIWERIVALIQKVVAWFKRTFSRRKIVAQADGRKIDRLVKQAEEQKQAHVAPTAPQLTFTNTVIAARLCVHGRVPAPTSLLGYVHRHHDLVSQIWRVCYSIEQQIERELSDTIRAYTDPSDAFERKMSDLVSLIFSSPLKRRASNQAALGHGFESGIVLFEEPLVFGGRSLYRTGVVDAGAYRHGVADAVVTVSGGQTGHVDGSAQLPVLGIDHVEALLRLTRALVEQRNNYIDTFNNLTEKIDALKSQFEHQRDQLRDGPGVDERSAKRARSIIRAFSMFFAYRDAYTRGLFHYDENVSAALMLYVDQSLKLTHVQPAEAA